ncbi:hypothetical protein [Dyadobacter beijingensis]|nr:hypothetical protein [Dyadobacter beijingensis]
MKVEIKYLACLVCISMSGCDYKYGRVISSMTQRTTYEAERRFHRKSNYNEYYNSLNTRKLIFTGLDSLTVEDDGKVTAVMFKKVTKRLPGTGEEESPHRVYQGRDPKWNIISIRITIEDLEENKPRLITSEVMDGEYNPAADSIWTYYKYKNPQ